MSKWISEFLPNKSGSYLITTKPVIYPINYMGRWEFDSSTNLWHNGLISTKFISSFAWWDEYGITENKIKKKIKF